MATKAFHELSALFANTSCRISVNPIKKVQLICQEHAQWQEAQKADIFVNDIGAKTDQTAC